MTTGLRACPSNNVGVGNTRSARNRNRESLECAIARGEPASDLMARYGLSYSELAQFIDFMAGDEDKVMG